MAEIQSLARGLNILDLLAKSDDGVGITTLAAELNIDKGSASRLMATLAKYSFAEKDPDTRRYKLGPSVVSLSRSLLTKMPLRETAKPFLHQMVKETGECAHLGICSQKRMLYIDQVESPETLRVNAEIGSTAPFHCTALGKALIAWGGAPLPEELTSFTSQTITDLEALKDNLEQTRKQGYALDDEEYDYGVRCIAAPVFDYRGKVVGAIGISGPTARLTLEKVPMLSASVTSIARKLSDKMSFKRNG